jgi:serine O-acetyltransferase
MPELLRMIAGDLRRKARWVYDSESNGAVLKVLISNDGTLAMVLYRLMQWSRQHRLVPLEWVFNKLITVCCRCVIGRGAEFGPGFVLVHAAGVYINGRVRGGSDVTIYQQVTLGGDRGRVPVLGNDVVVTAGAKVLGPIRVGDGARIGANSVVVGHVAPHTTVLGIPARPVWHAAPKKVVSQPSAEGSPTSIFANGAVSEVSVS